MMYTIPTSVMLSDKVYDINTDFRCILDIIEVLNDKDLTSQERGFFALGFFYPDFEKMPECAYSEAITKMYWFLNGGDEVKTVKPDEKVMDWNQDFRYIISPINRMVGRDVRADEYMHWWTFLGFYMEIGDGLFSQIVSIRRKKLRGIALDKSEANWYAENKAIVDFQNDEIEEEEDAFLKAWAGET